MAFFEQPFRLGTSGTLFQNLSDPGSMLFGGAGVSNSLGQKRDGTKGGLFGDKQQGIDWFGSPITAGTNMQGPARLGALIYGAYGLGGMLGGGAGGASAGGMEGVGAGAAPMGAGSATGAGSASAGTGAGPAMGGLGGLGGGYAYDSGPLASQGGPVQGTVSYGGRATTNSAAPVGPSNSGSMSPMRRLMLMNMARNLTTPQQPGNRTVQQPGQGGFYGYNTAYRY